MNKNASRRAMIALALLVPAPSIGVWMSMWAFQGTVLGFTVWLLSKVWIFGLPLWWYLRVERQKLSWSPARQGGLLPGLGLGVAISLALLATYALWGDRIINPDNIRMAAAENNLDDPLKYAAVSIFLITVNSLLEEFVWRWFVFSRCQALFSRWVAVVVSALFFTLHHIFVLKAQFGWGVTLLGSLGVFVGGAAWSACYLRYRSVWPGYVSHAVVDVAILWIGWRLIFGG